MSRKVSFLKKKKVAGSISLKKSILCGFASGMAIFIGGFFAMLMFWLAYPDKNETGLFSYKASALGDSICLPILIGSLVCYVLFNRNCLKKRFPAIIVSALLATAGVLIQLSWLFDTGIKENWTIHHAGDMNVFNEPGIWHAFFFVAVFALLGWLFTRYFQIKYNESSDNKDNNNEKKENVRDNVNTLLQYLIWTSGAFFIFLNFTDDHSEKSGMNVFGIDIFWFLLITLGVLFVIVSSLIIIFSCVKKTGMERRSKKDIVNDVILLLSGLVTAFAITNIINTVPTVNIGYIVAAALLLVIFVVPNTENVPGMLITYIVTALPAVIMEVNVTSYNNQWGKTIVICVLVTAIPVIIAVFLNKKNQDKAIHKKAAVSALALLLNITAVFLWIHVPDDADFQNIFQELINFVLVTVIPVYVKSVFDELLEEESKFNRKDKEGKIRIPLPTDDIEKKRLQKKRNILFIISAIIFVGVIVMMFSVIIPPIEFYKTGDVTFTNIFWIGIPVMVACVLFIKFCTAYKTKKCSYEEAKAARSNANVVERIYEKDNKRYGNGDELEEKNSGDYILVIDRYGSNTGKATLRRISVLLVLAIAYGILDFIIIKTFLGGRILPDNFNILHIFIIPALVFASLSVAEGYYSNMLKVRGYDKADEEYYENKGKAYVIITAIIIFFGTLSSSAFLVFQMIQADTILSIIVYMLGLFVSNVVLPTFTAATQEKIPYKKPQLIEEAIFWDSGRVFSVTQDCFLFSITSIVVIVITVFYVSKCFTGDFAGKSIVDNIIGLYLLLQFSSWALEYCVENDVTHFYRIRDNSDMEYKKGDDPDGIKNDESNYRTKQYEALHRHVSFQNVMSVALAMPYSIFAVFSMIFKRVMESGEKKPLFIPDIETGSNVNETKCETKDH